MYSFQALVQQRALWRARDFTRSRGLDRRTLSTGYANLDDVLYDHGWPMSGLVEILCDRYGIGELRLLTPALAKCSQQDAAWVVWINPPLVPYAPALHVEGLDTQQLLLVYPETHKEALWTLEEVLQSGSCRALVAWLDEDELTPQQIRKIQTQARQNGTWVTLFRPPTASHKASAAELRMRLDPEDEGYGDTVLVSILKRRGGWSVGGLQVQLSTRPLPCTLDSLNAQMQQWLDHTEPR